jgi:protein-disulfide isomerase
MALQTGDKIAGKYRIERVIGEGGMGTVYAAHDERLEKPVALKVLSDAFAAPDRADRFVREAIAASSVKHPGIVEIYEADVHEGVPWIAMELLRGQTLAERLASSPLPADEVIDVAIEALAAIEAVHWAGIVHRDLKPDNIFLEEVAGGRRRVKVLEFGIAKILDEDMASSTRTGTVAGTPHYLSPEQATGGKDIDRRADVYAMGSILFFALSGKHAYECDSFGDLVRQMYTTGPRSLASVAPHVSSALAEVIDRCLAVDRMKRPESAGALAKELERARHAPANATPKTVAMEAMPSGWGPQSSPAAPFGAPGAAPFGPAPSFGHVPGRAPAPPQRSDGGSGIGVVIAIVVGVLVVLGLGVVGAVGGMFLLLRSSSGPEIAPYEPIQPPIVDAPELAPAANVSIASLGLPGANAERFYVDAPASAPSRGPDDAPVTIVMFSDYQCPFCSRVEPTLDQLVQAHPNDLRIVWRDNPLAFHTNAMPAAELAREAHAQGGDALFWRAHDLLFDNQQALSRPDLDRYAAQLGMNAARTSAALDNHTHQSAIQSDAAAANAVGARGTPGFFVNGRQLMGAQPYEAFNTVVNEELELARALANRGVGRSQMYATFVAGGSRGAAGQPPPSGREQPDPNAIYRVPVGDSPFEGPADALVTIVEWSDFQCPFCSRVNPTLERIRETYGDDVRVVYRHNPLPFHEDAMPAAEASVEVFEQLGSDAFFRYHDLLFANQRSLEREDLLRFARQVGANAGRVGEALDDHRHRARIQAEARVGQGLGASGTPAFFVNGRNVRGAQPFEAFQRVIDEELVRARAQIARGTPRAMVYDALTRDGHTTPQTIPAAAPSVLPSAAEPDADRVYAIPVRPGAPSRGSPGARVTIQIFSEFQCPFCNRVRPTIDQLLANHPNDVRVVWRDYPLPFHQNAMPAAEAAREVHAQLGDAAFWRYHDILFENQQSLTRENLERWAAEVGANVPRLRAALDAHTHQPAIQADMDAVTNAGARIGTPSFFINGRLVQGAQPLSAFEAAVQRAM